MHPARRTASRWLRRSRRAWRRTPAHRLAYAAGLVLVLAGAVGSGGVYLEGLRVAGGALPTLLGPLAEAVGLAVVAAAELGGFAALLGGFLAQRGVTRRGASLLVALGSGSGLVGFALQVALAAAAPEALLALLAGLASGLAGLGALLALAAQARLLGAPAPGVPSPAQARARARARLRRRGR